MAGVGSVKRLDLLDKVAGRDRAGHIGGEAVQIQTLFRDTVLDFVSRGWNARWLHVTIRVSKKPRLRFRCMICRQRFTGSPARVTEFASEHRGLHVREIDYNAIKAALAAEAYEIASDLLEDARASF